MKISVVLKNELNRIEQLIGEGQSQTVFDRLMYLLWQMDTESVSYVYECTMLLKCLSKAAVTSDQPQLANKFINQAIQLLKDSQFEVVKEFSYLYLDVSEILMQLGNNYEAHFFAESALHTLADCSKEFDLDEIAGILRRYAAVARKIGSLSTAYLALTVGLLVMQDVSGLDSLMAIEASELTSLACQAASPTAIGRLGNILLRQAA